MSTNFDEAVKSTFAANLSAEGPFAELITATPKNAAARSIYAAIDRNPPEAIGGGEVYRAAATFTVQNHATAGLLMSEVATGVTVTYNVRYGDATSSRTVQVRLGGDSAEHDAATITLEVA